ncbi:aminotransferase-like domain-containing protein [Piscirickettsia litoralis]|uniref:GntR family transcriptional regulator n=1 Tax=Piscirickettsia litoralis TaxID=1891921 RepID=A0ABX3A6N7_9GAMM|nr:PLP-dependent aminotransferase family protein [Piscirickettsia litoralis]ODN43897.1 GntR family transcriptional regulator [Piscirickettsia litoralis]
MHKEKELRYEKIMRLLRQRIDSGQLKPGDRIPSLRKMSEGEGVSLATVIEAYQRLEAEGRLISQPQSGYYVAYPVKATHNLKAQKQLSLEAREVTVDSLHMTVAEVCADHNMAPFGAALVSPELLPGEKLARLMGRAMRMQPLDSQQYMHPRGYLPLRCEIAKRMQGQGVSGCHEEELVITAGCMEAIAMSLSAVTSPGDAVAVESPIFSGFLLLLESLHLKAIEVITDPQEGMDLNQLEMLFKESRVQACLLSANFQNPLGFKMSDANKQALVQLATRFDIPLIEDDIYAECGYGPAVPRSLKSFDESGIVLYCSSFSKVLIPGYRVGWAMPGRFLAEFARIKLSRTVTSNSPAQLAISQFILQGGYEQHLRRLRHTLARQVSQTRLAIEQHFPDDIALSAPEGGFLLWLKLPEQVDAKELFLQAHEKKISIVPGTLFSTTEAYRHCIRMSCGFPWSKKTGKWLD